jgi:hypothetical protein
VGDKLREIYGSDILAKLAIAKISAERKKTLVSLMILSMNPAKGKRVRLKIKKFAILLTQLKTPLSLSC